jgi:hypothetical protein
MELDYAIEFEDKRTYFRRIIPFFEKHQLKTRKRVDFAKFRKVVLLMEKEEHLKPDGLEKIRQIKTTMNSLYFLKIESNYNGNISRYLSEIPCRVSSDPHERRNDLDTVSERGSVK